MYWKGVSQVRQLDTTSMSYKLFSPSLSISLLTRRVCQPAWFACVLANRLTCTLIWRTYKRLTLVQAYQFYVRYVITVKEFLNHLLHVQFRNEFSNGSYIGVLADVPVLRNGDNVFIPILVLKLLLMPHAQVYYLQYIYKCIFKGNLQFSYVQAHSVEIFNRLQSCYSGSFKVTYFFCHRHLNSLPLVFLFVKCARHIVDYTKTV